MRRPNATDVEISQTSGERAAVAANDGVGFVNVLEDCLAALVIEAAAFGQADAARIAVEKSRAEMLLQPCDMLGDRGLRNHKIVRRLGETAKLDDTGENSKSGELVHVGCRRLSPDCTVNRGWPSIPPANN